MRQRWTASMIAGSALALLLGMAPLAGAGGSAEKEGARLPGTLPPVLFSGQTARAYAVAAEVPDVLAGLYCYCKCDLSVGHRHLLDCFRDDHGAG